MFPHTITIYNVTNTINGVMYNRREVSDVFYYASKMISQEGKGEKYTSTYSVIFSNLSLENYLDLSEYKKLEDKSKNFTLQENDIIVLGTFKDINNLNEIQKSDKEYFIIKTINDNRYGDIELQNIEVTN